MAGKTLVVIGGHPFSGRRELARTLADVLGAPQIALERLQRSATTAERYRSFAARIAETLQKHDLAVAVAPLWRKSRRAEIRRAADEAHAQLFFVECTSSVEAMQKRVNRQYASAAPAFLELRMARAIGQRRGYQAIGEELGNAVRIPIDGDQPLSDNLQRVLAAITSGGISANDGPTQAQGAPFVLVIDDDRDLLFTLREVLETAGCHVSIAASGRDALAVAASSSHAPDLVLLDYAMPDSTGLDLAPTLRQRWPDVEIVLLTAHDEPWLCDEAFREHVDEYLTKPVRAGDLFRLVDRLARD